MADADRNNAFWCYQCRRVVQRGVTEQDDSASCGICGSGFVEDLRTVDVQSALLRNRGRLRDVQGDLNRATESLRVSLQSISQMDSDDLGRFFPLVREIARGAPSGPLEVLQRLGAASSSSQANGNGGTNRGNDSQGESSLGDSASADSSLALRANVEGGVNSELEGVDNESSEGAVFDNSGAENSGVENSRLETVENDTSETSLEGEGRSRERNNGVLSGEGDSQEGERGGEGGVISRTGPLLNELEESLALMQQAFNVNDWESMSEGDEDDDEEEDEWEEWVEDEEEEEEEGGEEEEGEEERGEEEEENNNEENNNNEGAQEGVELVAHDVMVVTVDSESESGVREETGRRYRFRQRQTANTEGRETGTDLAATLQQLLQNLEIRTDRVRDMIGNPGGMYIGNPGDYLDARGFEAFVQHMAANDNSRRGPPPASKEAVEALILVHVDNNCHSTGLSLCAICKDMGEIGETMSQMPCSHLYHEDCIKQWLSSRNSCPVCRFELATDDPDYEEKRQAREIQREATSSSTEVGDSPTTVDHVISQEERSSEPALVEEESESARLSEGQADTVEDPDSQNRDRDINTFTVSDVVLGQNQGSRLEQYSGEHLSLTNGTESLTEASDNLSQASNTGDAIGGTRRANNLLDIAGRVLQLGGLLGALYLGHRLGRATATEDDGPLLVDNSSLYQQRREGGRHDFEDRYSTD